MHPQKCEQKLAELLQGESVNGLNLTLADGWRVVSVTPQGARLILLLERWVDA